MTKAEIVEAISEDKMMPFIQPDQLVNIVDFVIKNYKPSLPSNLDEAAEKSTEEYVYNEGGPFPGTTGVSFKNGFKAGAEWMAGQGVIIEGRIAEGHREGYPALCLPTNMDNRYSVFEPGDKVVVQIRKK